VVDGNVSAGVFTWVFEVDCEEERLSEGPSRRGDNDGGGTFCDAGAVTAGLLLATASMLDIVITCCPYCFPLMAQWKRAVTYLTCTISKNYSMSEFT